MDIPLKLRSKFPNLTADESAELKTFFANLPDQDFELEHLLEDNLDELAEVLLDKTLSPHSAFNENTRLNNGATVPSNSYTRQTSRSNRVWNHNRVNVKRSIPSLTIERSPLQFPPQRQERLTQALL